MEASAGTGAQQPADHKSVGEASAATAGDADLVWQEENVSMVCSCLCLSLRLSGPLAPARHILFEYASLLCSLQA